MIIGVDAGCLGVRDERLKTGVYQVACKLLKALAKIDKDNEYRLYSFYPIEKKVMMFFGKRMKNFVLKPKKGWFQLRLPLELKINPVNVFLGFSQALPSSSSHNILWVHDIGFEYYPHFYSQFFKKLSKNTKNGVKRAGQIIAVSQSTKKDLIRLYKVPEEKIKVCYLGAL